MEARIDYVKVGRAVVEAMLGVEKYPEPLSGVE